MRNNIECRRNFKYRTARALQNPRNMVFARYMSVNTLHKRDNEYNNNNNNNNNIHTDVLRQVGLIK